MTVSALVQRDPFLLEFQVSMNFKYALGSLYTTLRTSKEGC